MADGPRPARHGDIAGPAPRWPRRPLSTLGPGKAATLHRNRRAGDGRWVRVSVPRLARGDRTGHTSRRPTPAPRPAASPRGRQGGSAQRRRSTERSSGRPLPSTTLEVDRVTLVTEIGETPVPKSPTPRGAGQRPATGGRVTTCEA